MIVRGVMAHVHTRGDILVPCKSRTQKLLFIGSALLARFLVPKLTVSKSNIERILTRRTIFAADLRN